MSTTIEVLKELGPVAVAGLTAVVAVYRARNETATALVQATETLVTMYDAEVKKLLDQRKEYEAIIEELRYENRRLKEEIEALRKEVARLREIVNALSS